MLEFLKSLMSKIKIKPKKMEKDSDFVELELDVPDEIFNGIKANWEGIVKLILENPDEWKDVNPEVNIDCVDKYFDDMSEEEQSSVIGFLIEHSFSMQ